MVSLVNIFGKQAANLLLVLIKMNFRTLKNKFILSINIGIILTSIKKNTIPHIIQPLSSLISISSIKSVKKYKLRPIRQVMKSLKISKLLINYDLNALDVPIIINELRFNNALITN